MSYQAEPPPPRPDPRSAERWPVLTVASMVFTAVSAWTLAASGWLLANYPDQAAWLGITDALGSAILAALIAFVAALCGLGLGFGGIIRREPFPVARWSALAVSWAIFSWVLVWYTKLNGR